VRPDVLVIGEVLVELSAAEPLERAVELRLGFSGDALNSAAAAAAAGAHTVLLTRIADDELGARMVARIAELGIDTSAVRLVRGQHGSYFVGADPHGRREFVYIRSGSAASELAPDDLHSVAPPAVTLCSGITCAISPGAASTVLAAAQLAAETGAAFVYDPNLRPRLTTTDDAAQWLARLARYARLVVPSAPGETRALLGTEDPFAAAATLRALGAAAVAVTRGPDGVLLDEGGTTTQLPAVTPPAVIDQTGAGDVFAGTVAARLALGDDLVDAARLGTAAAALSLQGRGGTGYLASLDEARAVLTGAAVGNSA
jgi:2-dehydro-3-deoxygluconokinase